MSENVRELYQQAVLRLPERERMELVALIANDLARLHTANGTQQQLGAREKREAMNELLRFAGAASSGNLHAADNEEIDADLAREYGKDL